jgi:hypothetical protein
LNTAFIIILIPTMLARIVSPGTSNCRTANARGSIPASATHAADASLACRAGGLLAVPTSTILVAALESTILAGAI